MINKLYAKYEELIDKFPFKREYYHLNSIRNFLIHFESFGTELNKTKAGELLDRYLDFALEKESIEADEAKEIFEEYILPIGNLYRYRQNFSLRTSISTYLIFSSLSFLLFLLADLHVMVYFLTLGLVATLYLFQHKKYTQNKVFGFNF